MHLLSPRKKILVTGGSGFLGWHLASTLGKLHDVSFTYTSHPVSIPRCRGIHLDLTKPLSVASCFYAIQPDVVIHTAAWTDTGACQQNPNRAYAINTKGTERLLHSLPGKQTLFIHISTDLVFDGEHPPYSEESIPAPVSSYGKTKLRAEKAVQAWGGNYVILRVALMYGPPNPFGRGSFLQWMESALKNKEPLNLFSDEYRTPAYVKDVVRTVHALIQGRHTGNLYHLGSPRPLSRVEMGQILAKVKGFDASCIQEKTLASVQLSAPRARDVSMLSTRLQASLCIRLTPFETALREMKSIH